MKQETECKHNFEFERYGKELYHIGTPYGDIIGKRFWKIYKCKDCGIEEKQVLKVGVIEIEMIETIMSGLGKKEIKPYLERLKNLGRKVPNINKIVGEKRNKIRIWHTRGESI